MSCHSTLGSFCVQVDFLLKNVRYLYIKRGHQISYVSCISSLLVTKIRLGEQCKKGWTAEIKKFMILKNKKKSKVVLYKKELPFIDFEVLTSLFILSFVWAVISRFFRTSGDDKEENSIKYWERSTRMDPDLNWN